MYKPKPIKLEKSDTNRFSSFGLDTRKKTRDKGTIGDKYCPWADLPPDHNEFTGHNVQVGMSMCFSNFVICLDCALASQDLANLHKWTTNECFKCQQKDVSCYHIRKIRYPNDDIAICKECVELAIKVITKHQSCQSSN